MDERRKNSNLDAETQLAFKESLDAERQKSDDAYAKKIVETIVFTLLSLGFLGMAAFIWHVITKGQG